MSPAKKQDGAYIENLTDHPTNWQGDEGKFHLEPHGYTDSVKHVTQEVLENSFVMRALAKREILKKLTDAEANERILELKDQYSSHEASVDEIAKWNKKDADHQTDHWVAGVPDDAMPSGPTWSDKEIMAGKAQTNVNKAKALRGKAGWLERTADVIALPAMEGVDEGDEPFQPTRRQH